MNEDKWRNLLKKHDIANTNECSSLYQIGENALLNHKDDIEDLPQVIHSKLTTKKVVAIAGQAKASKSAFMANFASQISIGGKLWNHFFYAMAVLYFCTEMDEDDYKNRGWAEDPKNQRFPNLFFLLATKIKKSFSSFEERIDFYFDLLIHMATKKNCKVIVIDCLYTLLPNSSPKYTDYILEHIDKLRHMKFLVFVVVHLNDGPVSKTNPYGCISGGSNFAKYVQGAIFLLNEGNKYITPDGVERDEIKVRYILRSVTEPEVRTYIDDNHRHQLIPEPSPTTAPSPSSSSSSSSSASVSTPSKATSSSIAPSRTKEKTLMLKLVEHISYLPEYALETTEISQKIEKITGKLWKESNIKRRKLKEWVDAGILQIVEHKGTNFYYTGPASLHYFESLRTK